MLLAIKILGGLLSYYILGCICTPLFQMFGYIDLKEDQDRERLWVILLWPIGAISVFHLKTSHLIGRLIFKIRNFYIKVRDR